MESNKYNNYMRVSEAVVVGGLSLYFYKKISDLEAVVEDLKNQIVIQNNQIRYLIGSINPQPHQPQNQQFAGHTTPLKIPHMGNEFNRKPMTHIYHESNPERVKEHFNLRESVTARTSVAARTIQNREMDAMFEANSNHQPNKNSLVCEGDVCKLVPLKISSTFDEDGKAIRNPKVNNNGDEKLKKSVVISKISKHVEYDRENVDNDQTFKVNTFTNSSPNPVLKSVTPNPSTSAIPTTGEDEPSTTELDKILNEIDDEN
jgi:hypothetical protein